MATTPRKPAKPRSTTSAPRRATPTKLGGDTKISVGADGADAKDPVAPEPATTTPTAKPARKAAAKADVPKTAVATPPAAPAKPASKTASPPKPRSTKRAAPRLAPKPVPLQAATPKAGKSVVAKAADKVGGGWGAAALAGGLVAAGAAALLTLRSSAPKAVKPVEDDKGAHQADGTDSSKSFEAGIADEGTIPS